MTIGSVVIPAYNEEAVIGRCLERLLDGLGEDVEVVVACNGCSDRTAERARAAGPRITVLELPEPGKAAAIRAAEARCPALPRVYLDADSVVSGRAVLDVVEATRSGAVAARPPLRYDTTACSWPVRRYYRARARVPSLEADLCGAGFYALSREARERFAEYPDVTGDDLFAARIVAADEVTIVQTEPVEVRPARTSRSLLWVLRRVVRGNRELTASHAALAAPTTRTTSGSIFQQLRRPATVVDACIFTAFAVTARVLVRLEAPQAGTAWERDDSARSDDGARSGAGRPATRGAA